MYDYKFFRIKRIPDLTLNKYNLGNVNGIDGIMEMHNAFLRQWNRKGMMSETSIHLFYIYDPQKEWGDKLDVMIGIRGPKEKLHNIDSLINSSNLMNQFEYEKIKDEDIDKFYDVHFNKMCVLTKKELFIHAPKSENDDATEYYSLSDMEINEEGRLFQMLSLMEKFNEKVMYRVDLYPVDMSDRIRSAFENTLEEINKKKEKNRQLFSIRSSGYLDNLLKTYDGFFENIESSPHFIANIMIFGNYEEPLKNDNLELLLDAAASENVESGNYSIKSFLTRQKWHGIKALFENKEALVSIDQSTMLTWGSKGMLIHSTKAADYNIRFMPVLWCINEVSPFFRLPLLYENEEIQKKKETVIDFETVNRKKFIIEIGEDSYKDSKDNGRKVKMKLDDFVKHTFISGVPGSGKTNAILKIISELNNNKDGRIPFLVFEPAKKEYRALFNTSDSDGVVLISPHMNSLFPIRINPFEFPKGVMLSRHIGNLMRVFSGSFTVEKIVYELLDSAIEQAYIDCGWELDDVNDEYHDEYPTLAQVYTLIEKQLEKYDYDVELKGNVSSFIRLRLGGLMKRDSGEIFNVKKSTWRPEEWLKKSVIIELEALAEQDKNFMVLLLCNMIYETITANSNERPYEDCKLRHVIIIEEAHNIIAPESEQKIETVDPKISATQFIVKMLAEVRALGEGIIIADQIPTAMAPEVLKNTVNKFVLKMISGEDREIVGQAMLASPIQLDKLVTYSVGKSLYIADKMQKPMEMQFSKWQDCDDLYRSERDEVLFERLKDKEEYRAIWLDYFNKYYEENREMLLKNSRKIKTFYKEWLFVDQKISKDGIEEIKKRELKKSNNEFLIERIAGCKEFYQIARKIDRILVKLKENYPTETFLNEEEEDNLNYILEGKDTYMCIMEVKA